MEGGRVKGSARKGRKGRKIEEERSSEEGKMEENREAERKGGK